MVNPRAEPLTVAPARLLEQIRREIPQRREFAARPEAGERIEVVRGLRFRLRRHSSNHGSHGIESHQLETSCDLRRSLREECWA